MKPRRKRLPSICYHKPSGRDYVRLAGKMTYLGPHGDPGNQAVYDRLMAEFLGGGRTIPPGLDDSRTCDESGIARDWMAASHRERGSRTHTARFGRPQS